MTESSPPIQKHDLQTVGQEYVCRRCHRRWDFDEAPDENDPCDAPAPVRRASRPSRNFRIRGEVRENQNTKKSKRRIATTLGL